MTKSSVVKSHDKLSHPPSITVVVENVSNSKVPKKEVKRNKKVVAVPDVVPEEQTVVVPEVVSSPPIATEPETVPVDSVSSATPVTEPVELVTETSIVQKLIEFNTQLMSVASMIQSLKAQYKTLEKSVNKELKTYSKVSNKKSKRSVNRPPSGFVRPTKISDELASFLGKASGVEMARTEVSKEIIRYIREHDLQNKSNGRQINADVKLSNLLKLKEGDVLTYFNLQRYMKHHFVKKEKAVVA
jgi:chromatin remodeling complex protein RSC6